MAEAAGRGVRSVFRRVAILLLALPAGFLASGADAQTRIRVTEPEEPPAAVISEDWLLSPPPLREDDGVGFAPLPAGKASWRDTLFLGSLGGIEAEILRGSNFAAGISARSQRPHHRLELGRDDSTLEFGAFGELFFDDWKIVARVGQDLSDTGGGFVADLGLRWASQISDSWRVELGSEISWASDQYTNRFYGVGPRRASEAGLRLYDAAPGLKDLTFSGSVTYSISDNWTIGGIVGAQRLMGSAADSPLVKDENEYFGGFSLDYRF